MQSLKEFDSNLQKHEILRFATNFQKKRQCVRHNKNEMLKSYQKTHSIHTKNLSVVINSHEWKLNHHGWHVCRALCASNTPN